MKYCILVVLLCSCLCSAAQNRFLGTYQYNVERKNITGSGNISPELFTLWFSQNETWRELKVGIAKVPPLLISQLTQRGMDSTQIQKSVPKEEVVYRNFQRAVLNTNEYWSINEWAADVAASMNEESCIVKDTLPDIDWTLLDETKRIDTFTCQKAVGQFRGRTWYAWYYKQIPIPTGPWKLHGLPGMILEATDSLNEVKFIFKSLSIPAEKQPEIPDYSKFKIYSRQGFMEKEKKRMEGVKAFMMSAENGKETYDNLIESRKKYNARPIELDL